MRVTDLDRDLMIRLVGALRAEVPTANVVLLGDESLRAKAPNICVTSSKLVELRNPLPNLELRPPLLVFIPNDLRASAEDSFSVATFEEIAVGAAYSDLVESLRAQVPSKFTSYIWAGIEELRRQPNPWKFANDLAIARFLLTARINDFDPEAIGASLFELSLVPDFELLTQPEGIIGRLARNRECVESVTWSTRTERARALELGLSDSHFRKSVGEFFARVGVSNPQEWTKQIVSDRANWNLSFNKWSFEDGGINPDAMFIGDISLPDLPVVKEDEANPRLAELIGHRVLTISKTGLKKFGAHFRVDPFPSRVQGLSRFVAEVISQDNGPTGLRRRKATWAKASDSASVSFPSVGKIDWEEGWHYVRILAETEDGDRIPLLDGHGQIIHSGRDTSGNQGLPNESELFYVLTDENVEIEPPQRAVPREASLAHALMKAKFSAVVQGRDPQSIKVSGCSWVEATVQTRSGSTETLDIRLGKEGKSSVIVSRLLADIERKFLNSPETVNRLSVSIGSTGRHEIADTSFTWPSSEEVNRFREARSAYFAVVLQGNRQLITQASELLPLTDLAVAYAQSYTSWLENALMRLDQGGGLSMNLAAEEIRLALSIDLVEVAVEDFTGDKRNAVLIGPSHPLRTIWHTTWSRVAELWLERAGIADKEYIVPTREAVMRHLNPSGFPAVLPLGQELGRSGLAVDNISPFWSLYAAPDEGDPRGLIGEVCAALGLPEPAVAGATIDSSYIGSRIQRYLVQHPYIETLTINAFNPGRGALLRDALLALQREPEFQDLRYDIRLFAINPYTTSVGEALLDLLGQDSGMTAKEADAFSTPTESHLHPKLRIAVRSIREFRDEPDSLSAHLTFLFDVFPAEEIRSVDAIQSEEAAFAHGLIQPFGVDYFEDEQSITWLRRPLHGDPLPLEGFEELSDILSMAARTISVATASVARTQFMPAARPVIALSLTPDERALLHQVHEVSDWVITIDRNLGIEFFDHRKSARPDYIIDHSPDVASASTHRLVITSRSVSELEALLLPILEAYHLPKSSEHALVMLDQLRSLSGRLALKLLSATTQKAEALGLALSRLFLEHQGVFLNQIVVPLDAHLDLYKALQQNSWELGEDVSFRRTDLALFDLNVESRVITVRLVEVKCYSDAGNLSAFESLKQSAAEQISQSEKVLRFHFDSQKSLVDRADRSLKNRDLASTLGFYLDRSIRYGLVLGEAADEARLFLRQLDQAPYELKFTRSAVIFDFSKQGTEEPQTDYGIEFYRIGRDLIVQMMEAAVQDTQGSTGQSRTSSFDTPVDPTADVVRRRTLAPGIPTFESAAFQSEARLRNRSDGEQRERRPYQANTGQNTLLSFVKETSAPESFSNPSSSDESVPIAKQEPDSQESVFDESPKSEKITDSVVADPSLVSPIKYDIVLGSTGDSPQFGILGEVSGRKVALDLNQTHTISLFGVQGGGKSYTLGSIAEMASMKIPGINLLPEPLATVIFHYSPTMDYKPEFTSMVHPNSSEEQVRSLRENYGALPAKLSDVLMLVPVDKLQERRAEYPEIEVRPLQFSSSELKASHWKFLMGAVGSQANYIRQVMRIMKSMRDNISLEGLRAGIESSSIPEHLKEMARSRLDLASEYIDDHVSLTEVVRPGRLVIVDLRDEFIEKDQALGLFVVLLQLFADARIDGKTFNKLVVFDEAHKYIESPDLVAGLIEVVREMRHKGVSIMVASQDPPSVPVSLIELSSQVILHKFNSPAWLKHIQKANAALANLTPERMASLKAGEAFVWSSKASDEAFSKGASKIRCRPRVTQHGGETRVAVED
jgi:hypothetical protein